MSKVPMFEEATSGAKPILTTFGLDHHMVSQRQHPRYVFGNNVNTVFKTASRVITRTQKVQRCGV